MVYVDDLQPSIKTKNWAYLWHCHLIADKIDELHLFAKMLRLDRSWYQHKTIPHYDLTKNKRREAIKLGAIQISKKEMVEFIKKQRIVE